MFAQTSEYAVWAETGSDSGTGSFVTTSMPDYTWTVTGDVNTALVDNAETWTGTNGIESIFGEADNASNLNFSVPGLGGNIGDPVTQSATLNVNFNSATPSFGWAFSLIDFDADQAFISATDSGNNPVSTAVINSWFQSVFDIDGGSDIPTYVSTGVPANTVVVYGSDLPAPVGSTYHTTIIDGSNLPTSEAGALWFMPNISLNSITIQFQTPWDQGTASMHAYIAFNEVSLPVDLIDFSATTTERGVELSWTTSTEINNEYWTVERSFDSENFEEIVRLNGIGTTYKPAEYFYEDLLQNKNIAPILYYRLKQVDLNGNSTYSNIKSVNLESNLNISMFPNPVSKNYPNFEVNGESLEDIQIFSLSGQEVYHVSFEKSRNTFSIPIIDFISGVYFVRINNSAELLKLIIE